MDQHQSPAASEEGSVSVNRRRRRRKGITSASFGAMDQITIEFILPTAPKNGLSPHTILLEVAGNWTVEQVGRISPVVYSFGLIFGLKD